MGSDNNYSHDIFSKFPDLEINIIKFNNVYFSNCKKEYLEKIPEKKVYKKGDLISISGTEARNMLSA